MLKAKVLLQYNPKSLEQALNDFLKEHPGQVRDVRYSAEEDFFSALVLYEEGDA